MPILKFKIIIPVRNVEITNFPTNRFGTGPRGDTNKIPPIGGILLCPAAVDLWLDAAEGDYSGMAMITLSKNLFLPTLFTWGHFLSMGVSSGDYHNPAVDYDAILSPKDSLIGAPLSNFLYWIIAGWPANTIDEQYFEVQPSDVQVLMVSGNVDFSTPPQYATEELLPQLSNGEQVILQDFGNTESIWFSQPEARAHFFSTFFDTGEVDASLYEYQPVDFTIDQDWRDLMRTFIILIVVVIAYYYRPDLVDHLPCSAWQGQNQRIDETN